jgi:Zn-dependent protease with chaperone function/tetratricopeptide (TPR) repeat protein
MFGLLPLLFALTVAETATRTFFPSAPQYTWWHIGIFISLSLCGWLAVGEIIAHWIGRLHRRRVLARYDIVVQALILLWYGFLCYGMGYAKRCELFTAVLAPWVIMNMVHWWTMTPAMRIVSGHPWKRSALVLQQLRFGILPMLFILPFLDIGAAIARYFDWEAQWFSGAHGALLSIYCTQLFMVAVLIFMPLILMPLWGVKKMTDEEVIAQMRQACEKMGVKIRDFMRWPSTGGRLYNAAIIGVIARFRYVLFTDDLLRDMPRPQVMAVLGHELGHARHGHLWLYFLFANTAILLSFLVRGPLADFLENPVNQVVAWSGFVVPASEQRGAAEIVAIFILLALFWRLVFGVISRMCERQADLVGAELAGDPLVMCDALKAVAHLSGHNENEPSWRHYSIAQRVAFLRGVQQQPQLALQHHRRIRMLRHSLILIIIALVLLTTYAFDPSRVAQTDNPQAALTEWSKKDHDLATALTAADNGNHILLSQWLNRAEPEQRQMLGHLVLRQIAVAIGVDEHGDPRFDDRPIYHYRHRLRSFFDVSVGTENNGRALERELDNTLAYGLVAGTEQPTDLDLQTARLILPRLEKIAAKENRHEYHDTIGCIYFVAGDFTKAVETFEKTALLLSKDTDLTEFTWFASEASKRRAGKIHQHLTALYQQRLDAARANAKLLQEGKTLTDPALLPLPRDIGNDLPLIPPTAPTSIEK